MSKSPEIVVKKLFKEYGKPKSGNIATQMPKTKTIYALCMFHIISINEMYMQDLQKANKLCYNVAKVYGRI